MTGLQDLGVVRDALKILLQVVHSTCEVLNDLAQELAQHGQDAKLLSASTSPLSKTLTHIEAMREGFVLSQRTEQREDILEMQAILEHILFAENWWEDFGFSFTPERKVFMLDNQLISYNHALITMTILPTLPAQAITFPQMRPTYADVFPPTRPAQILERIEEVEKTIYKACFTAPKNLSYHAFRRTYAFFEASDWLARNHLAPLLKT